METVEEERKRVQYFAVDNLDENTPLDSLILAVNQTQPGAYVALYIDCVSQGKVATPRSMRDMFIKMKHPNLELVSGKIVLSIEVDEQLMHCDLSSKDS